RAVRLEPGQVDRPRGAAVGGRPAEVDLPLDDPPRPIDDAQDRPRRDALPTPTLPHDPQRRPRRHIKAHPIHRPHRPLVLRKIRLQIPDRQQRLTRHICHFERRLRRRNPVLGGGRRKGGEAPLRVQRAYGSAASRSPSPRKLKAMTARITGMAGIISQGEMATVWTFWACCSRTPQLIAGGRRPRPRKLSAVSLMIIAGRASVVAAMMWLMNDGTMCTKMVRISVHPTSRAETTKSSSRMARKRPRTTRASSVQPSSEMMIVMAKYTWRIDQSRGRAAA